MVKTLNPKTAVAVHTGGGETIYRNRRGTVFLMTVSGEYQILSLQQALDWLHQRGVRSVHEDYILTGQRRTPMKSKKSSQVRFKTDSEMLDKIDQAAKKTGMTRSEWIREILTHNL